VCQLTKLHSSYVNNAMHHEALNSLNKLVCAWNMVCSEVCSIVQRPAFEQHTYVYCSLGL